MALHLSYVEYESPEAELRKCFIKNLRYLLLKAQRMAVTKTEFITVRKAA